MNIELFSGFYRCVTQDSADFVYRDAFSNQLCGEIMPKMVYSVVRQWSDLRLTSTNMLLNGSLF
jgi:hypothetical protein